MPGEAVQARGEFGRASDSRRTCGMQQPDHPPGSFADETEFSAPTRSCRRECGAAPPPFLLPFGWQPEVGVALYVRVGLVEPGGAIIESGAGCVLRV
jgi:hypothetical protein